jgi:hypothetical protein
MHGECPHKPAGQLNSISTFCRSVSASASLSSFSPSSPHIQARRGVAIPGVEGYEASSGEGSRELALGGDEREVAKATRHSGCAP